MHTLDAHAIAERIRGLIGGDRESVDTAARRLGVPEFSLRMSTDDLAPTATLEVLAAVVNAYGVDPSWLLYGEYDSSTHRRALDDSRHITPTNILHLVTSRPTLETDAAVQLRLEA